MFNDGKADEISNTIGDSIIGGLSNSIGLITNGITTNNVSTPTPLPTSSTANIGTMPNAGFQINALNILKIVLGLSLAGVILYTIYNKRYSSK